MLLHPQTHLCGSVCFCVFVSQAHTDVTSDSVLNDVIAKSHYLFQCTSQNENKLAWICTMNWVYWLFCILLDSEIFSFFNGSGWKRVRYIHSAIDSITPLTSLSVFGNRRTQIYAIVPLSQKYTDCADSPTECLTLAEFQSFYWDLQCCDITYKKHP